MAELDEMLRRYLQREEDDPIRKRLESMANWTMQHERQDADRHNEVMLAITSHDFRIGTLESISHRLEGDLEDSKQHDIKAIMSKNKRYTDLVWRLAALALSALLAGGIVELVHRLQ